MDAAIEPGGDSTNCSDLPPIPQRILGLIGVVIETSSPVWRLGRPSEAGRRLSLNWELLDQVSTFPCLTERARHLLQLYIADQLTKRRVTTIRSTYQSFLRFFRWLDAQSRAIGSATEGHVFDWSDVEESLMRAFLDWCLTHSSRKGNDFARLRALYAWGVARGYPDFCYETLEVLKSIKAPGNATGHNVRFRHPTKGPFSPEELIAIRKAIQDEQGTDRQRAIVMIHLELGLNPYATVRITNADFKRYETKFLTTYQLDVPRMKKRTVHREAKRRPISSKLGQLLEQLQQGRPDGPLFYWLAPSEPEKSILRVMRLFVKAANIRSPRTGALLRMHPRRFRTSLATSMAGEGASKFHIAEVLDHSDLSNVDVYTQTVSSIVDEVARATDSEMEPLVKRFLGTIVDSAPMVNCEESAQQVIPALAPHLPIPLPMLKTGGVGLCGRDVKRNGLCRLLPPLSCYLCPSFVAFRHGPHEEMLDALLQVRQLGEEMGDERIKRQLDDVCAAIIEVLAQLGIPSSDCALVLSQELRKERSDE